MDTQEKPRNFSDTLKQMWASRPPRIPEDQGGNAHIAGVCEGIGVRYQIDPLLVRVLFVVTTLAVGGGLAAYLLAWGFMPRYGLRTAPLQAIAKPKNTLHPKVIDERSTGWLLLIGFILFSGIIGIGVTFSDADSPGLSGSLFSSSAFFAIALMLAAWYGLHHLTPVPPYGLLPNVDKHPADTDEAPRVNLSEYSSMDPQAHPAPPEWDPLGTAPFAWHLPDPPPRPKKKHSTWRWVLIGFSIALPIVVIAAVIVFFLGATAYSTMRESYEVTSAEDLREEYRSDEAALSLNLYGLDSLDDDTATTATATAYPLQITLPQEVPVHLVCETSLASTCESGTYNVQAGTDEPTLHLTVVEAPGAPPARVDHPELSARVDAPTPTR